MGKVVIGVVVSLVLLGVVLGVTLGLLLNNDSSASPSATTSPGSDEGGPDEEPEPDGEDEDDIPQGPPEFAVLVNEFEVPGLSTNAGFGDGIAVSEDGSTIAVAAPQDNSNEGGVFVFVRSGGAYVQQGPKLVGSGAVGSSQQGGASNVAISSDGSTIVFSSQFDDASNGAAWVFFRTGTTWAQQSGKLTPSDNTGAAGFGAGVDISADGNLVVAGGPFDNSVQGAFWMFRRTGVTWAQVGTKYVATGSIGAAGQGNSVAISGDGQTVISGGFFHNSNRGAAWVFVGTEGVLAQQAGPLEGTGGVGGGLGRSVAVSGDGNLFAIGAGEIDGNLGALYVYRRSGTVWTEDAAYLEPVGHITTPRTGLRTVMSSNGRTIITTGWLDNTSQGGVFVHYEGAGETGHTHRVRLLHDSPQNGDNFGASLGLSRDGRVLVVGARGREDGKLYVYESPTAPET